MKTFISKLAIATILSIALVTAVSISSYIYRKTPPYRTAAVTQTQPGPEIIGNSYSEMVNSLFATSGR